MKLFCLTHSGFLMSQRGVGKDVNVSHDGRCMTEDLKNPDVVDKEKINSLVMRPLYHEICMISCS